SSSEVWARLHEQSFRRLGGSVHTVVLDNLKEGVLAPDVYDPALNPLYRDVLSHYGVIALPCRVRDVALNMKDELERMKEKLAELKLRKGSIVARAQQARAGGGSEQLGARGGSSAFD